mgnify:CR=1 FL=1
MTAEEWHEVRSEQLRRLHAPYTVTAHEFAGFDAAECFALGVEFAQIWEYMRRGNGGMFSMHTVNQPRFEALCKSYGVQYSIEMRPPRADGWYDVTVHLPIE